MANQHFCLRWNNHQSTLVSVFDSLLESGTLVDCTLAAEGRCIQAHKVLLSACSPYFAMILSQHYDKHPILILKDVKFHELQSMLDYMYRGEVNITQDNLGSFLKAAESLQIKGLTDSGGGGVERDTVASPKSASPVFPDKETSSPSPVPSKPKVEMPVNNIKKPQTVLPNLSQVSRSHIPPIAGLVNQPKKPLKHIIDSLNKNNEIKRRKPIQPMKFENSMIVSPMSVRSHNNHLEVSNASDVPAQAPSIPVPENKAMHPLLFVPSTISSASNNVPQSLVVDKENKECDSLNLKLKNESGSDYTNHDESTMDQYNDDENEDDESGSDFDKAGPSHDNSHSENTIMRWETSSDGNPHDMSTTLDSQGFPLKGYMPWVGWDPNPKYVRQTSQNQYSCQHCGKRYRWKSTLKRHEVFECGGKEPAHQCPHCDYRAKQSGNLRVHIRKYHSSSSIVPFVPVHPANNTSLDLHMDKKTAVSENIINNNN